MRIKIRMSIDCMHFTFFLRLLYMEQDIRRNWSKPLYVGLHLDQQPSESVYLKNDVVIAQNQKCYQNQKESKCYCLKSFY